MSGVTNAGFDALRALVDGETDVHGSCKQAHKTRVIVCAPALRDAAKQSYRYMYMYMHCTYEVTRSVTARVDTSD